MKALIILDGRGLYHRYGRTIVYLSIMAMTLYTNTPVQFRTFAGMADMVSGGLFDNEKEMIYHCMGEIEEILITHADFDGSVRLVERRFSFNDIYLTFME